VRFVDKGRTGRNHLPGSGGVVGPDWYAQQQTTSRLEAPRRRRISSVVVSIP
jgi:hypothetical protein